MHKESSKKIFITGASSGIGEALSDYYAGPGTTLALLAPNEVRLQGVADRCRAKGATVYTYSADVRDVEKMRKCAHDFLKHVDTVDIVIANAGIRGEEDEDCQEWQIPEELMQVNYLGVINTFSPFIPYMKRKCSGQLVVMSSIGALRGTPNSGAYSASKAAINIWAESLRLRLKPYKIQITVLCMGFVATAMTEGLPFSMPGLLTAKEAAVLIAPSIAKRKRLVTLPWQSRFIWNTFHLLPGCIYDKLILWAKSRHKQR